MSTFDVCVTITSALLAIAYPILVEVISRLDEKYFSIVITDLFNEETIKKAFIRSIYISILFIIMYLCGLKPLWFLPQDSWVINNSAVTLLAICNIVLVIFFFFLIEKVFVYYRPKNLVQYLIKKHNSLIIVDDNDYNNSYFVALSELLLYSIKIENAKISKEINGFVYLAFKKIRDKQIKDEVNYPTSYYNIVYQSIEELAILKSKKLAFLENMTAGSVLILGELQNHKISSLTYSWLWSNQRLSLRYGRDDFLIMHWENAHQYYDFRLPHIQPQHSENFEITNQEQIDNRFKEKKKFFIFHTVLGALILFQNKYSTLKKFFNYTQSIPPRYALLPERIDEIFILYFKLNDDFNEDFNFISTKFPFPDFDGLHADEQIKEQISVYLALLFLRQYSIVPYLVYQKPLMLPALPESQGEKKNWLQHLPWFKKQVLKVLANKNLLTVVQLDFITDEYCKAQSINTPLELLDEFETSLKESLEETEVTQTISPEKEHQFLDTTTKIMLQTFENYKDLDSKKTFTGETSSNYINGTMQIFDKSTFAESQGFTHINFDSFLATTLADKFTRGVSESFFFHKSEQYLFRAEEIESVIDKMNIKQKDFAIVSFKYNIDNLSAKIKLSYNECNYLLLGNCLFILKENDLPSLFYNDTKDEYKTNYQLQELANNYKLYASLIDLNLNENLHQEIDSSRFNEDIRTKVLATIYINTEIRWKKNLKCVYIRIASPYREEGILSNLNDVKPF